MRLNDDDKRVLAAIFHGAEPVGVSEKQVEAAGKTFTALGFTDQSGQLTQRGRHVAKSLPFAKVKNVELQRQGRSGVERKSRSCYRGRDQAEASDRDRESTERSNVAAANRPDDSGGSDACDLPGADPEAGADSGAVRETITVSTGRDVVGG